MRQCLLAALIVVFAAGACTGAPPDRRSQVTDLTERIRTMPGVVQAGTTFNDDVARGPTYFEMDVDVADDITGDQLAALTSAYLDDLQAQDYTGYGAAFDVRRDGNLFSLDTGNQPADNREQILAQARSWVALRRQLPGSAVGLRATTKSAPNSGTIQLPDTADYTTVAATVGSLAAGFGELTGGDWTVSAGNQRPAEIRTSRRLPTQQEMELWIALNTDQSIPHTDVFTINGSVTGPLWVSEKVPADDPDNQLRLAQLHLPIVARLPVRTLYSATNQFLGHIGFHGQATGPVTVSIGGCIKRDYRPSRAEQALIDMYENCRR